MTNKMEMKVREFWLYDNGEIPFLAFYSHVELLEDTSGRQIDTYHVIEKSAFDRLLAEAEKMSEQLMDIHVKIITGDPMGGASLAILRASIFQAFKKEMGME